MPNPSFHLFQLQKNDLLIDNLDKRLSEIDTILKDNRERLIIESTVDSHNKSLESIAQKYHDVEIQAIAKKTKIEQSESSLYSGTIKNPKELQDLQLEIKSLKSSLSGFEDLQLELLEKIEFAQQEVDLAQKNLEQYDLRLTEQHSSMIVNQKNLQIERDRLIDEKNAILSQIQSDILTVYENLRKTKKGVAVSGIEDGCCSVCGTTLTPAECQSAKSPSRMSNCPSCGRVLYAG